VGGPERVVHVGVREVRQAASEGWLVALLAGVEAEVLEQEDLAIAQLCHGLLGRRAYAVVGERDATPEQLREPGRHGAQREGLDALSLRSSEVRSEDHPGAGRRQAAEAGQAGADAAVVAHDATVERDVQVGAHEHATPTDTTGGREERLQRGNGHAAASPDSS
jgi:hypothetical protein